jgi:energy-coupling factor transporter ATP-binding protein EcfA2
MFIILEGPDGAGKTTLANQLRKLIEHQVPGALTYQLHRGVPTEHPLDEYLRSVYKYRPGGNQYIICDRWHWGESVYPELLQRPTKLDFPARWAIDAYLKRLGTVVVLVDQFDADYIATYAERGEFEMITQLTDTKAAFAATAATSHLPFMMFNWKDPAHSRRQEVIEVAAGIAVAYKDLNRFTTYCGPRYPQWLLFGDVRHNSRDQVHSEFESRKQEQRNLDPAFVPFPATSGHYLLSSIEYLDPKVRESIGWANACDVDDPVDLWRTLGSPRVVALGRNAQRKLDELGVPHGSTAHPQFARRFHSRKKDSYGASIEAAATRGEDLSLWPQSSRLKISKTVTLM